MAEIIHIREILRQREQARSRARDRENLERAVGVLRESLEATAHQLVLAPAAEQSELLERAERLVAMIRYGLRMLGESPDTDAPADPPLIKFPSR